MAVLDLYFKHLHTAGAVVLTLFILGFHVSASSDSLCVKGFQCIHGTCTSGVTCQCDDGWTGTFCNKPEVSSSNPTLPPSGDDPEPGNVTNVEEPIGGSSECFPGFVCQHGMCHINDGIPICTCTAGWEGYMCDRPEGQSTTTHRAIVPIPTQTFHNEPGLPLLQDLSVRRCIQGFECRYGNCTCDDCDLDTTYGCVCEQGWVGVFCHNPCPVNCGPHGDCSIDDHGGSNGTDSRSNGTQYRCECHVGWTGNNCSSIRRDDESDTRHVTILYASTVCGGVVLVLILLVTIVLYLLWRRGNISMLKLVFWFQTIEEDDGRLYDAFVSYASTEEDRQFVMECLIPVLEEQMAFTLCIHERDFMPGKYITSNILESVRQSRRTLLVISPAFVSRNWCQFEFQMAVAEMIEKKSRILPVMIGDVKKIKMAADSNETFHRVINTVTYLQYPNEGASDQELQRFWKRLELSMPKKSTQSSTVGSPVQTPTSITPISLSIPPLPHDPHKGSGIIFPQSSTSLQQNTKTQDFDDVITEPLPGSNNTNCHSDNSHHMREKKPTNGFIAWFRRNSGSKKNSNRTSIYAQNKISNSARKEGSTSGSHLNTDSINSDQFDGQARSVEGDEKTAGGHNSCGDKGVRTENPLEIAISGWSWPAPETSHETC